MALGDLWNRTLVYFGIAEEDEWDDDYAATEELERTYEEPRANVRRLSPRRRDRDPDDWTQSKTVDEQSPSKKGFPRLPLTTHMIMLIWRASITSTTAS